MDEEGGKSLHIVMFPWLAIGHLRPFFRLSECLAAKGHRVSFISSPRNLDRCPKIPSDLSHLINLVSFPLPHLEHLPPNAESSMDVPHVKQQLLKVALDRLQPSIRRFLQDAIPKPDWIVYDYASHWLPEIAGELGIRRAYFSLFTAAFMAFLGPPSALLSEEQSRSTAEDYTVVPDWITFPTKMAFRLHEMTKNMDKDAVGNEYSSGTSDSIRFGLSIDGSDIVIIRSYIEFEPEWFDLIRELYKKPVIPIGVIPTTLEFGKQSNEEEWQEIKKWLDTKQGNSIVYVALGTEAVVSKEEINELAIGLENCGFPFFWVLNRDHLLDLFPKGFCQRVKDRGMVYTKWAPQIEILGHPGVGGFLTHCGWNSVSEALGFGRVLILLPLMNDQGLNARLLEEKKVGIEVRRHEEDGGMKSEWVVDAIRIAMVGEEGRSIRENVRKMRELFGNQRRTDGYIDNLIDHMVNRSQDG